MSLGRFGTWSHEDRARKYVANFEPEAPNETPIASGDLEMIPWWFDLLN